MKRFLPLIILIFSGIYCFSQEKPLVFTDNSSLEVKNTNNESPKVFHKPVIKIINKEFTAFLTGIGKAFPPLNNKTKKNIGLKNSSLAMRINRINSAYNLTQNDSEYYFAGLNSINYDGFRNCSLAKSCKVRCQSIIIQTKDSLSEENILIIISIKSSK